MVEDKSASSKKDTKGTEEATKTESGEDQKSEGGENKATTESDETQSETTEKVLKVRELMNVEEGSCFFFLITVIIIPSLLNLKQF